MWGDLARSRYFSADAGQSVERVVRALSVRAEARHLGQSFQGHAAVRNISAADHAILAAFAEDLPLEPRARLLPEERLEAAALAGDSAHVHMLIREEAPGIAQKRREYLYGPVVRRARGHSATLRELYGGRCQVCEWTPRGTLGADVSEAHHAQWLSRGGADELENLVLLCPNHHRLVHALDAPLDYGGLAFDMGKGRAEVRLNLHLPRVA